MCVDELGERPARLPAHGLATSQGSLVSGRARAGRRRPSEEEVVAINQRALTLPSLAWTSFLPAMPLAIAW